MASGEVAVTGHRAAVERADLPRGFVVTSSGRVSGVTEPGTLSVDYPFPVKDLVFLDDALKYGSRAAKARFAVYIGDLGADTAATARQTLAQVPTPNNAVLLAVSPDQRAIEVVYGVDVKGRGIEESAPLGVSAAAASFKDGNLMDGLISAIRVLSAGVSRP
ncbi:DUF5130 domain-containing protein [Mycobacterium sp. IDR2000157661]|uniref:DUF5130 domain-containing protein n=1 Tax=Mycobacterium sp. IDR2000157661 TaxID=2867005 RepID=UPI001EEBBCB5|nr:DUF5130 domain-containing protein [Mycobacterium sp. IDR2000157661]ULE31854.1 DUF5130 domain-containing protein [Mycobacterium sp. IDR2000157661]